jgi:hypothetical protein
MGTTLTALNGVGRISYKWVLAIEGYQYLLTDGDPDAALTAWTGMGWSSALGGLFIHGHWEQSIDPWNPSWSGGALSFSVMKTTAADTFGVDVHKAGGGTETRLSGLGVDANDMTVAVKRADDFAASGDIHIGTECIGYSSRNTSTDEFTVATNGRGKFAPFKANTETQQRFARCHYPPTFEYEVEIRPAVTSVPRTWEGRWVGLWMHREVAGTLDTRAEAQLMFAGKIAEISDTPDGLTRVDCKHVLSSLGEQVIFRDQYTGRIEEGVFLKSGQRFTARDWNGTTEEVANDLDVVSSGASGANQVNEGYYTVDEICATLNRWLYSELDAARLHGKYDFAIASTGEGTRGRLTVTIDGDDPNWSIGMPGETWEMLGGFDNVSRLDDGRSVLFATLTQSPSIYTSFDAPLRIHPYQRFTSSTNTQIYIDGFRGSFVDQRTLLPPELRAVTEDFPALDWGVMLIDGMAGLAGKISDELFILRSHPSLASITGVALAAGEVPKRTVDEPGEMSVKQVILMQDSFANIVATLFASTGTTGYNHATYDALGYGLGAGVPWELLGTDFQTSLRELDASVTPSSLLVYIDRPTKLVDLLGADLVLRRAHLVWKNQGLRFTSWSTPNATRAVHTLTESNKFADANTTDTQRTAAMRTTKWLRNLVKVEYNRDFGGAYRDVFEIHDQGSLDDVGEVKPVTISARNTFGEYASTGEAAEALGPAVTAWLPFFSRAVLVIRRTIGLAHFASMAPGDIVTVSDDHVRDPATGLRGISGKPGIVTWHSFDIGGPDPLGGAARGVFGEVEIALLDVDRVGVYSPSAMVDYSASNAGYNAGTKVLTCLAHVYSLSSEAADATHFVAGDLVTVVEIDPTTAASPTSWNDTVASQSGNTITLTTGLAGWDTSKKYRVISQAYGSATSTQKADVYQADDADGLITDVAQPYEYGADFGNSADYFPSGWTAADLAERHATLAYGDGKALDTGYERGMCNTINAFINYHSAPFFGFLDPGTSTYSAPASAGWHVAFVLPIFIGSFSVYGIDGFNRYLYVSMFARGTTGSPKVRITLTASLPVGDTNTNVTFPPIAYEYEWTLTGDNVWRTISDGTIDTAVLANTSGLRAGLGFLTIEFEQNAEIRGFNGRLGPLE